VDFWSESVGLSFISENKILTFKVDISKSKCGIVDQVLEHGFAATVNDLSRYVFALRKIFYSYWLNIRSV